MKILITGASSGIGRELALSYAKQGHELFITGRNQARLEQVDKEIVKLGGKATSFIANVCDQQQMRDIIHGIKHLDLVIANAGISTGTMATHDASESKSREVIDTNIWGVVNTVYPAIDLMKKQGSGQIGLISSMASFRGLGGASAYCSSKAFVRLLGESLHVDLKKHNIHVSVICPGWVKSALTDKNEFSMPFILETDQAVKKITKGLHKKKPFIKFPWPIYLSVRFLELIPMKLSTLILHKLPTK